MESTLVTFLNLLAEPPGDLIFHLVVCMSLLVLVTFSLANQKLVKEKTQAKQILLCASILLILQLVLVGFRLFTPGFKQQHTISTALIERVIAVLMIIWLVRSFFSNLQHKLINLAPVILSIGVIILGGISLIFLPRLAQNPAFNVLLLDILWQFIGLALAMIGLVLMIFNHTPQRPVLFIMLLLFSAGHITQILFHGDFQWRMSAIRFVQTLSLPWILVLTQRFAHYRVKNEPTDDIVEKNESQKLNDTKPALVNQLLAIGLLNTNEEIYLAITQALSLGVVADICYLVEAQPGSQKIEILCGYDLIRETGLKPDTLARDDLPGIMAAWQAGQHLEIDTGQEKTRDAVTLAMVLQYHEIGSLFAYPLGLPESPVFGGVIFLSPYTGKTWNTKTKQLMDEIKLTLTQLLITPIPDEKVSQGPDQDQLLHALAEKEDLVKQNVAHIQELKARYQIEKVQTTASIERLQSRLKELSLYVSSHQKSAAQLEQMKIEIRQLSDDNERLTLELSQANSTIKELQTQTGQTGPIRLSLDSQVISLDSIAANARLQAASQLKHKNINLEIHNPDGRQMIKTDPELLQTALLELINNAIKASGWGTSIRFDQKLSLEMGMLIIQVTDFGAGLLPAEQTALFSGQHDSIPGIGDVQAIRKAIQAIRVLNGKVWLKSKKDSYATFRFQIPVRIVD